MKKEDCYFLGKITRTHGLQGNVVLKLDTDQPELYNRLDGIFVEINGLLTPFFVDRQQWHKNDKIISFRNSTEAMIEQVTGKNVFLPLSTLPPLSGNQFYYHEVIGFRILDEKAHTYGIIKEINDQTAQHYFILDLQGREVIVPIIKDWILRVDRDARNIIMQLPDGLLDVFLKPADKDEDE